MTAEPVITPINTCSVCGKTSKEKSSGATPFREVHTAFESTAFFCFGCYQNEYDKLTPIGEE